MNCTSTNSAKTRPRRGVKHDISKMHVRSRTDPLLLVAIVRLQPPSQSLGSSLLKNGFMSLYS
jgi:hypothetical protein